MAALIKALNAKIRSNPVSDYLCSTRECCPDTLSWSLLADVGHSVLRVCVIRKTSVRTNVDMS